MLNFCFVILHYKTVEDTIDCVDSIDTLDEKCQIVIVDNASNNGSIEKVEEYVKNKPYIYVIKNKENVGFADGNNIGYKFAKNVLHADFIAISNNDIIIDSQRFIHQCMEAYKKNRYYILGPDIESMVDHGHQNPMIASEPNIKHIRKEIIRYQVLYILSKIGIYDLLKNTKNRVSKAEKMNLPLELAENVQLHGSFLVFSPLFIKKEELAFRPGTFLYMEESILFTYCKKMGYKTVFYPAIKVFHKEDSSTNSMFTATKHKREFVFKNMIRSLKVYYHVLKES